MNMLILTNRYHRNDRSAWKEQLDWILSKQKTSFLKHLLEHYSKNTLFIQLNNASEFTYGRNIYTKYRVGFRHESGSEAREYKQFGLKVVHCFEYTESGGQYFELGSERTSFRMDDYHALVGVFGEAIARSPHYRREAASAANCGRSLSRNCSLIFFTAR